jgi:hypothetical protein
MKSKINFSEVKHQVSAISGIYEIYTLEGIPLKVGIASNLKKRLLDHYASSQASLKKNTDGEISNPSHLISKRSILAKHLYFDQNISKGHDLRTEKGRKLFLENHCYILIETTESKEAAREIEKERESSGKFRYVGRVTQR